MNKKILINKILVGIAYFLAILIFLFGFLVQLLAQQKGAYIKHLPNIDGNSFNGFLVNGKNIYETAFVSPIYWLFPNASSLSEFGKIAFLLFLASLIVVCVWWFFATGIELKKLSNRFYLIHGLLAFSTILGLLVGFAMPLNGNALRGVLEQQFYDQFGRELFNDLNLKNELNSVVDYLLTNFGQNKFTIYCIFGLSFSICAIFVIAAIYVNKLSIYKNKNLILNDVTEELQGEVKLIIENELYFKPNLDIAAVKFLPKEFKTKNDSLLTKVKWARIIVLSSFSFLMIILFFILTSNYFQIIYTDEQGKLFFNELTNEHGQQNKFLSFELWNLFNPTWAPGSVGFKTILFGFFIPIWLLTILNWGLEGNKFKYKVKNNTLFLNNLILLILSLWILINTLLLFNSKLFENAFNIFLNDKFEKNYLIKTVGLEELNMQRNQVIAGIKNQLGTKFEVSAILITIVSTALIAIELIWGFLFIKGSYKVKQFNINREGK